MRQGQDVSPCDASKRMVQEALAGRLAQIVAKQEEFEACYDAINAEFAPEETEPESRPEATEPEARVVPLADPMPLPMAKPKVELVDRQASSDSKVRDSAEGGRLGCLALWLTEGGCVACLLPQDGDFGQYMVAISVVVWLLYSIGRILADAPVEPALPLYL
jgi:hypothetical protein